MDLTRHGEVMRSHRKLLLAGLGLALVLSYLASYRPGTLAPRHPATWTSTSTLLVTQTGFPWGRAALPSAAQPGSPLVPLPIPGKANSTSFAEPTRFNSLAVFYAALLESDPIKALIPGGYAAGAVVANAGTASLTTGRATSLPLVMLHTTGATAAAALQLNRQAAHAFTSYLTREQDASNVPSKDRVQVTILNPAAQKQASKSIFKSAFGILLLVLIGTLAVAYLHDNATYRRRQRATSSPSTPSGERWSAPDMA